MASLKKMAAARKRKRLPGASTPRLTGDSSAAQPAAAPAARAVPAAAQMTGHGQDTHNSTPMSQHARAVGDAAATLARSAEQHEAAPVSVRATSAVQQRSARAAAWQLMMWQRCLARILARHTPPAVRMALPSLAALLATARMQVGQVILPPWGAVGRQRLEGCKLELQSMQPERAGQARSGLTCMLARRWHVSAQPRRRASA